MKQLKINLDQVMQILHNIKNMELEITEEEEDSQLEKQLQELQRVQLQKRFWKIKLEKNLK